MANFKCKEGCCQCCSPIPFTQEFLKTHAVCPNREIIDIIKINTGEIIVYTRDFKCIFLNEHNRCSVYNDRPQTCEEYGMSNKHPCPYINSLGAEREPSRIKKLNREWDEKIERMKNEVRKRKGNII